MTPITRYRHNPYNPIDPVITCPHNYFITTPLSPRSTRDPVDPVDPAPQELVKPSDIRITSTENIRHHFTSEDYVPALSAMFKRTYNHTRS